MFSEESKAREAQITSGVSKGAGGITAATRIRAVGERQNTGNPIVLNTLRDTMQGRSKALITI